MGQLVAVTEKPSSTRGVVRFEINRSLSGMGHEHFASAADAWGNTPSDELARRMFATEQVDAVHVYGNIITVDIDNRSIDVDLSVEEIDKRIAAYKSPEPLFDRGVMAKYSKGVSSASLGAIT